MPETRTPSLEMLWENRDPAEVLTDRFGFDGSEAAAAWVGATMRDLWGIEVGACQRIVMSDANALAWVGTPVGRLLVKWSVARQRFPRLRELARLTAWLDDRGLPVSRPLATLDGRLQVEIDGASVSAQRVIAGDLLDVTELDRVRELGVVLARLHDAMAGYPYADELGEVLEASSPIREQVVRWLEDAPSHVPPAVVDALRRLVDDASPDPSPPQVVHGDVRSANVLCVGADVAAVLDFEEARCDQPIAELARSAVLLGTRFHDWGPVPSEVCRALLDGYRSVRDLSPAETQWWHVLVLWHCALMIPAGEDPTGWKPAALAIVHQLDRDG